MALRLRSKVFEAFQQIPKTYTGEGQDRSPPLKWSGVPEGTREFVLSCEDPDAPLPRPFLHWLVFHISANTTQLPEGLPKVNRIEYPVLARQAKNSSGGYGYTGPMPPLLHGPHHYYFKLYALDAELSVPLDADYEQVLKAMHGHILDEAQLVGFYERGAHRQARQLLDRSERTFRGKWKGLGWLAGGLVSALLVRRLTGRTGTGAKAA